MADTLAKIADMQKLLQAITPAACPRIIPDAFKDLATAEGLLTLAASNVQRVQALQFINGRKRAAQRAKVPIAEPEILLETEVDIPKRTFKVVRARAAEPMEALLSSLDRILELQLLAGAPLLRPENAQPPEDSGGGQEGGEGEGGEEGGPAAQLEALRDAFAEANELGDDVSPASALQEAVSLAYAIRVAASALPGAWKGTIAGRPLPLPEGEDLQAVLADLFAGDGGSGLKKGKRKGKKGGGVNVKLNVKKTGAASPKRKKNK